MKSMNRDIGTTGLRSTSFYFARAGAYGRGGGACHVTTAEHRHADIPVIRRAESTA
jgi:hypothetical protein